MKRILLATVGTAFAVAACGSTVQVHGTQSLGGSGATQAPGSTDAGQTTPGGVTGPAAAGTSTGTTSVGGVVPGGQAPGSQQQPSVSGGTGPVATAPKAGTKLAPIEVGVLLFPDLNAFAGKFGGTANAGDQSLEVDTAAAWVNKHGGAAGHQIKVVKHNVSLTSSDTYDQLAQAACEDLTVDHHAVAVIAPGTSVDNTFAACLNKHGAAYLVSGHYAHDAKDWRDYPNMYSPGESDVSSVGRSMVDLVLGRAYAKRGEKVGLMVMEQPAALRAADNVIKPQLKAAGIDVVEYTVPNPASTADISNSVAVDDSAELKMASQNIKTVLFMCPGCLAFFAQNADSQKYYPRYVGSSIDTPAGITGTANDSTMKSAVMVGWEPDRDVGLHTHPNELTDNAARTQCRQIEAPNGQAKDDLSEFATVVICDSFLQVAHAAALNPANPLTGPAIQRGLGLFGTAYPSALNFSTRLAADHHGGETSYRTLHWDLAKHAFVYDNPKRVLFR